MSSYIFYFNEKINIHIYHFNFILKVIICFYLCYLLILDLLLIYNYLFIIYKCYKKYFMLMEN